MREYFIKGGNRLCGNVTVQGSKNSALPIIACAVMSGEKQVIHNVPLIDDVFSLINIFEQYGVVFQLNGHTLTVEQSNLSEVIIDPDMSKKLRSSSYLIGAILPNLKRLYLPIIGGCSLGLRPLDIHFRGFEALGGELFKENIIVGEKVLPYTVMKWERMIPTIIYLRYPSVGATINLLMLSSRMEGEVVIVNAGVEPEVKAVIDYLKKLGVVISGNKILKVRGKSRLKSAIEYINGDRIVVGDILLSVCATSGDCEVGGFESNEILPLLSKITKSPCKVSVKSDKIRLSIRSPLKVIAETAPYPGFPTDLQAQLSVAILASNGIGVVRENIFENRFKYVNELQKMGARTKVKGNTLYLMSSKLVGQRVTAPDLRGGSALVIAGLVARGYTNVENISLIERGYENLPDLYSRLGGEIKAIE